MPEGEAGERGTPLTTVGNRGTDVAAIWRTQDRMGRDIELTDARWTHIMEDHENDMTGREEDVRATVERPDRVTADANDPRRECL